MLLDKIKFASKIFLAFGVFFTVNSFSRSTYSLELSTSKTIPSEVNKNLADSYNNRPKIITSQQEIDLIESLIQENIQAYQQEDIEGVMNTMHPHSPANSEVKELSEYAFEYYDIYYEQNNFEVVSLSNSEAVVRITQTARTIQSSDFKNNRTTSLQTLKKHNGQWKFFGFLGIENIEYLN